MANVAGLQHRVGGAGHSHRQYGIHSVGYSGKRSEIKSGVGWAVQQIQGQGFIAQALAVQSFTTPQVIQATVT